MRAMLLERTSVPLRETALPVPSPGPGRVLVRVQACAVCRTDLHLVDGELPEPKLPLVPGHEIVGTVVETFPLVRANEVLLALREGRVKRRGGTIGVSKHDDL